MAASRRQRLTVNASAVPTSALRVGRHWHNHRRRILASKPAQPDTWFGDKNRIQRVKKARELLLLTQVIATELAPPAKTQRVQRHERQLVRTGTDWRCRPLALSDRHDCWCPPSASFGGPPTRENQAAGPKTSFSTNGRRVLPSGAHLHGRTRRDGGMT